MEGELREDKAHVVRAVLQMKVSPWEFWSQCSIVVILGALAELFNHRLTDLSSIHEKGVGPRALCGVRKVGLSFQGQANLGCLPDLSFFLSL